MDIYICMYERYCAYIHIYVRDVYIYRARDVRDILDIYIYICEILCIYTCMCERSCANILICVREMLCIYTCICERYGADIHIYVRDMGHITYVYVRYCAYIHI